uniref:serpin-Z1-like n=1 Tax=Fragaria vesca subsp. vesca TaxID=101020 RepID=UPI0005C9AC4D|nr:PREDICTED: serpin-Z1-like [Fragaria vesca subsp. vesca]
MVYVQTSDNSYKEVACCVQVLQGNPKEVDFKANPEKVRVEVNSWVEKETQGLITDILSPNSVTDLTRRIFASALYFKGSWSEHYDFYEPYTYSEEENHHEFHLLNGDTIKGVPFMTSSDSHLIKAFDGFKVLKLIYQSDNEHYGRSGSFSTCLLLPDAIDGLPALAARVCSEPGFIDGHLSSTILEWVEVAWVSS